MARHMTPALVSAAAIGVGGFFGALARHATAMATLPVVGERLPWGTLTANLLGCLLMGLLKAGFDRAGGLPPALTLGVLTGFLGSYTTYSTFSLDTITVSRNLGPRAAALYVGLSVLGGIGLCLLGLRLGGGLR